MARFSKDRKISKGLPPGSLTFIGNKKMESSQLTLMDYDNENLTETHFSDIEEIQHLKALPTVSWINVYGIHDPEIIQKIGNIFDIPPLLLEDILNTDKRPKFEEGENILGFILKVINYDTENSKIQSDQISIVLGKNYVISFQEQKANFFDPVRERIRNSKGLVRSSGSDYLVYILLDTIIDNYLDIIATIGEQIEELGKKILIESNSQITTDLYNFKIEFSYLRKNVRPVKEMILLWLKSDTLLIDKKTKTYLHDLADLITQAEESIEIYNNLLIDGLNIHNTNINNRANEIMKVLTVFAAFFIPLTFLAGVYGMNFKYVPELDFRYSYPIFWGVVLIVGITLFLYFKRKKWL